MKFRYPLVAGALFGMLAATAAEAAPGTATGSVNMRTGPGTSYARIATIPAGAPVNVLSCPSWCQVTYAGRTGWVSSNYIARGYAQATPRYVAPPRYAYPAARYAYRVPMPPRADWRYGRPWWDDRYGGWYDGRRWYYGDRWEPRPRIGFGFGIYR